MKQNELVSIIMPSYNTASFISEAINSVLSQTYNNWELLIVDDCSTDNTDEIVMRYDDLRIKYLKNKENLGAALSRNKALRKAKGKWIAFLDSDDLWVPEKLEKQINFMRKKGIHFSYTCYEEIDEKNNLLGKIISGPSKITKIDMRKYCWPGCLTVMYDAEYVGLIQIADIKKNNDYAMWLKVSQKTNCYLYPRVMAKYRRGRKGSISTYRYITLVRWHYKMWHEAEKINSIGSIIYTGINLFGGIFKKIKYVKTTKRKIY